MSRNIPYPSSCFGMTVRFLHYSSLSLLHFTFLDQIKVIAEISYRSEVKSVKLKQDRVLVALENKIFLYNFSDLKLISSFETCPNPLGLISMNSEGDYTTIACLDVTLGLVNAITYVNNEKKITQIKAHESSLNAL